jgi:hypothetical protein
MRGSNTEHSFIILSCAKRNVRWLELCLLTGRLHLKLGLTSLLHIMFDVSEVEWSRRQSFFFLHINWCFPSSLSAMVTIFTLVLTVLALAVVVPSPHSIIVG